MTRRTRVVIPLALAGLLVIPALVPPRGRPGLDGLVRALVQSAGLPENSGSTPAAGDLILRHARIVDARGARGPFSIRIEKGRITRVGDDVGAGLPEIDVGAATVMPGVIDAHVHLSMAPSAVQRQDDAATSAQLRAHHLRAYLASGVTTILDPGIDNTVMEDVRAHLRNGHAGPRFLGLGTPLATPGGYLEHLFPPGISAPGQVGPHLDALVKAGAVGLKMTYERGLVVPIWRLHPPEIEQAVAAEAAARKLPVYVHAQHEEMMRRALVLHPHAFVHSPRDASDDLAATLARTGIAVVSTLSLFDAQAPLLHPEELQDPQIQLVVPAAELASIVDPAQIGDCNGGMVAEMLPFVPGRYRDLLAWLLGTRAGLGVVDKAARAALARTQRSIMTMEHAGVAMVLGSDSGNWPLFSYFFHGPTTWRELRLLAEAGLSPAEVLAIATINPARMLGLEADIGTVEVGKVADLLVVDADPLRDVEKALRALRLTVRAGVARTPKAWMTSD